ncbi:mobilisation protein (MobC) [Flavobacterium frigidimaris]|nr:mobilisation protein (MobC) [Flavobacterium frigidimaris]
MMKRENSNRTRIVGLRFTPMEYAELEKRFRASTCRKLSDHIRRHLFNKPIVTTYRNASFDDYIEETITLNSELNSIGNNINQIAKKMNSFKTISEFKTQVFWFEVDKKKLLEKIEEIKIHSQKLSEQWLQL